MTEHVQRLTIQQLASHLSGAWQTGRGCTRIIHHALISEALQEMTGAGLDTVQAYRFAIEHGDKALQIMSFIGCSAMLKAVAKYLIELGADFYVISTQTGTARDDNWVDIEGGIDTLFTYTSLGDRGLPDDTLWPGDELIPLSKRGGFAARHVPISKSGVAVHINAFNFPCWGILERLASARLVGMPAIIKPVTAATQPAQAVVKTIIDSGLVPNGATSLTCGGAGGLPGHLGSRGVVTFTGFVHTGQQLRAYLNLVVRSVPFTMKADSFDCCVLGDDVTPERPEFVLFVRGVVCEVAIRAGRRCTTIRRIIVPQAQVKAANGALITRPQKVVMDGLIQEGIGIESLVNNDQRQDIQDSVNRLVEAKREALLSGKADLNTVGAFFPPALLFCPQPDEIAATHAVEAFDPVAALIPHQSIGHATTLARAGEGGLAGILATTSDELVRELVLDVTRARRRIQALNERLSVEPTGHGSPPPLLVYGGPGRADDGEELDGLRAVEHYMQCTTTQSNPTMLTAVSQQRVRGARVGEDRIHLFRKYFEGVRPGDSLLTPRRTLAEADIVNFACFSSDHFYIHTDKTAIAGSILGERVVHDYFLISAVAGLFIDAGVGPVIINYGMESPRFIELVRPGDIIQVRLTCKYKAVERQRNTEEKATGVMEWSVEISSQHQQTVALYPILTLIACQHENFPA